jgi:hypothetical protein
MATAEKTMLDGTVEMDETYVGGKRKGKAFFKRIDQFAIVPRPS